MFWSLGANAVRTTSIRRGWRTWRCCTSPPTRSSKGHGPGGAPGRRARARAWWPVSFDVSSTGLSGTMALTRSWNRGAALPAGLYVRERGRVETLTSSKAAGPVRGCASPGAVRLARRGKDATTVIRDGETSPWCRVAVEDVRDLTGPGTPSTPGSWTPRFQVRWRHRAQRRRSARARRPRLRSPGATEDPDTAAPIE